MRPLLPCLILLAWSATSAAAPLSPHLPADTAWVVGLEVPALLRQPLVRDHLPALLRGHGAAAVEALLDDVLPHDPGWRAASTRSGPTPPRSPAPSTGSSWAVTAAPSNRAVT